MARRNEGIFFIRLFSVEEKNKKVFLAPWKYLFVALLIFIVEEALTVLRSVGILNIPRNINGFFEVAIISIFIYTLLLQHQYMKKQKQV